MEDQVIFIIYCKVDNYMSYYKKKKLTALGKLIAINFKLLKFQIDYQSYDLTELIDAKFLI